MDLIERIRDGVEFKNTVMVEIGPLYRPFIRKSEGDVRYVDHTDTETLREKYKDGHGFDPADIVQVDAIWGANTLQEALGENVKADYIFASHVIEHVPDLLTWLQELRSVLKAGGEIRLVIPDKRFTFDFIRRETAMQDLVEAYVRRARRPLPANIFDHVNYVRRVDTGAAWAGPLDANALEPIHSFEMAVELMRDTLSTENYHDVHCWVFTPYSFARLMAEIAKHGFTDLACHAFEDTLPYTLEFTAFLRAGEDQTAVVESWMRMVDQVNRNLPAVAMPELVSKSSMASLADELAAIREREIRLTSQLAVARAEAAAYQSSTSWRLTKPLRRIASALRPYTRRLGSSSGQHEG